MSYIFLPHKIIDFNWLKVASDFVVLPLMIWVIKSRIMKLSHHVEGMVNVGNVYRVLIRVIKVVGFTLQKPEKYNIWECGLD